MKEEYKQVWVNALRSGEYLQGRRNLRQDLESGEVGYCCLGVLLDVAGTKWAPVDGAFQGAYFDWDHHDPAVDNFAALSPDHRAYFGIDRDTEEDLTIMNDVDRDDFETIADYIENEL